MIKIINTKIKQPFEPADLGQDLQAIKTFYQNEGFLSVQIENKLETAKEGKIVYFLVNEGARVKINAISIAGYVAFSEEKVRKLLNLRINDNLITSNLEEASKRVIDFYKNSGYPYISVEYETKINRNQADVYFTIQEGPLCFIKEVKIRGNYRVKSWTVIRATEIKPGEKFSQEKLYQAQRRLYATRLFERVTFSLIGIEIKQESIIVNFDVSELPPRGFNFGLGYQLPPSRFLFGLGWEHLNILNRGQNLTLNSEFTPNFKGDYELDLEAIYKVPYLIRVPLNFSTRPFLNLTSLAANQTIEFGLETGVDRYLGSNWELNLSNRFRQFIFSYSDTAILDTVIRRGITNSLIFNITYDSRDNFFNPNQGLYVSPIAEVAGGLLLGNNDFHRYSVEFRVFQEAFGLMVFAARALGGAVLPYGRTLLIPYYEKYFAGGRNTLRGYNDYAIGPDSIGNQHYGDFLINTNFEIRTGYYKNFGLVLFWDGGEVEDRFADFKFSRYQYSAGIGLRFNTPVGPIRLDYGKRLKNPPVHDRGKLYIGLLHAF